MAALVQFQTVNFKYFNYWRRKRKPYLFPSSVINTSRLLQRVTCASNQLHGLSPFNSRINSSKRKTYQGSNSSSPFSHNPSIEEPSALPQETLTDIQAFMLTNKAAMAATAVARVINRSGMPLRRSCRIAVTAPSCLRDIVQKAEQIMAMEATFRPPAVSSPSESTLSSSIMEEEGRNSAGEINPEAEKPNRAEEESEEREFESTMAELLSNCRKRIKIDYSTETVATESDLGLEKAIADVISGQKSTAVLAYLEGLGVRPMNVKRIARTAGKQSLLDVVEKVDSIRQVFNRMEPAPGRMSQKLTKMLTSFHLQVCDDHLEQTFSFLQKLAAQRGGLSQLDKAKTSIPRLLESFPEILQPTTSRQLYEALEHMCEEWNLPRSSFGEVILSFPPVLMCQVDRDLTPRRRLMKQFGISVGDMGPMVVEYPWLLSSTVSNNMPVVKSFLVQHQVTYKKIEEIFTEHPSLAGCSPESLAQNLSYFHSLGVRVHRDPVLISRCPLCLNRTPEQLRQVNLFLESMGVDSAGKGLIASVFPQIYAYRVSELKYKLRFLSNIGIDRKYHLRIVRFYAKALIIPTDTIKARMDYLASRGLRASEIIYLIVNYPMVLGYSVENVVAPKLDFLEKEMGRSIKEVVTYGKYFSFSLEKKIRRRARVVANRGVKCDLKEIFNCTDDQFAEKFLGFGQIFLPLDK